jgi:riboflavin kinase / FMN adenylyltransferase
MSATGLDRLPQIGPSVITLGVFDGVHLGHRRVVSDTAAAARRLDAAAVALVFSPHPDEVIRPGDAVPRLLPPELTLERLRAAGIDHPLEIRFDGELRALTPEDFLASLAPALELRGITMTAESAFGRGRAGTLERIREIGSERGFDTIEVTPAIVDGETVSSSRIRAALAAGEIHEATRLLDAPPLLRGVVVVGDRRGRELGFPTANLSFSYTATLPALGIYFGRVRADDRGVEPGHPALVSVGERPTFHQDGRVLVEAYLLDWDGDLYGATLDVEFIERLRDERRFETVEALVEQMQRDEVQARRLVVRPSA